MYDDRATYTSNSSIYHSPVASVIYANSDRFRAFEASSSQFRGPLEPPLLNLMIGQRPRAMKLTHKISRMFHSSAGRSTNGTTKRCPGQRVERPAGHDHGLIAGAHFT